MLQIILLTLLLGSILAAECNLDEIASSKNPLQEIHDSGIKCITTLRNTGALFTEQHCNMTSCNQVYLSEQELPNCEIQGEDLLSTAGEAINMLHEKYVRICTSNNKPSSEAPITNPPSIQPPAPVDDATQIPTPAIEAPVVAPETPSASTESPFIAIELPAISTAAPGSSPEMPTPASAMEEIQYRSSMKPKHQLQ